MRGKRERLNERVTRLKKVKVSCVLLSLQQINMDVLSEVGEVTRD